MNKIIYMLNQEADMIRCYQVINFNKYNSKGINRHNLLYETTNLDIRLINS